ncbi:MAG: HIT family protein [Rickettsiales bacterium]|nr:HIT family protein [Rickettsiales bacterium]
MFTLDIQLKKDCFLLKDLSLSQLLLMNDQNYYWFILVPKKENLVELIDLDFTDQQTLLEEINQLSKILKEEFLCDKINIATLGNVVKQLHIHIVGRFNNDISFPKPIWGLAPAKPYKEEDANNLINKICQLI